MSNISPLPYRDVIKKLRKLGFVFRRATGGSHEVWWNEKTKMTCVVPHHKEVKAGTLRNILRQAGISEDDFIKQKQTFQNLLLLLTSQKFYIRLVFPADQFYPLKTLKTASIMLYF